MGRRSSKKQIIEDMNAEEKLRFYGAIQAFNNGKLPTTSQLAYYTNQLANSNTIVNPPKECSQACVQFLGDIKRILLSFSELLLEKNQNDRLQWFIFRCRQAADSADRPDSASVISYDRQASKEKLEKLEFVGMELISSGKFRNLIAELFQLLADLLKDYKEEVPDEKPVQAIPMSPNEKRQGSKPTHQHQLSNASNSSKYPASIEDQRLFKRYQGLVTQIHTDERFKQGLNIIMSFAESISLKDISSQNLNNGSDVNLTEAVHLLLLLLESFANNTSLDALRCDVAHIFEAASNNPNLLQWLQAVKSYVYRTVLQKDYVNSDSAFSEFLRIKHSASDAIDENMRNEFLKFHRDLNYWIEQIETDPTNKMLKDAILQAKDTLNNPYNQKKIMNDMVQVFLPDVLKSVSYLPLPRIEVMSPEMDIVIENVILPINQMIPSLIEVRADNFAQYDTTVRARKHSHILFLHFGNIRCNLYDMAYYFKKKKGMSKRQDTGVIDISFDPKGIDIDTMLTFTSNRESGAPFFKVTNVNARVNNLKLKLKKSKHKFLFTIFKPIATKAIKKALELSIKQQLEEFLTSIATEHAAIQEEVEEKYANWTYVHSKNKTNAPTKTRLYTNAIADRIRKLSIKAQEAAAKERDGVTVNVAQGADEAMLKNVALEKGITYKAQMVRKEARSGSDWVSPFFEPPRQKRLEGNYLTQN